MIKKDKHLEFSKSIINGVEIKRCKKTPHSYKPHVHKELSLGYIVEGDTDLSLSNTVFHYSYGDGVIIPPLMTHRCEPTDIDHWAYIMLYIEPEFYEHAISFNQAQQLKGDRAKKLIHFINQLLEETDRTKLETILVELLLEFGEETVNHQASGEMVASIREYIINKVENSLSLAELEQIFGISKFTIIRQFKEAYKTTPAAYHLQLRVAEAKRLLSDGLDVFDICERLNFYDQAHFIREFKKMHGTTPAVYMEQLK